MAGRKGNFVDEASRLGSKIGNWTIIGVGYEYQDGQGFIARCECGNYAKLSRQVLIKGQSTRCNKCRPRFGSGNGMWAGFKDIPKHTYSIMCKGAALRNIPVEVTIEDLQAQWEKQSGICALTGLPIVIGSGRTGRVASVDRIDNKRGYTKDNIQWVHKDVNLMKNKFDEDYFYEMCKRVVEKRAACLTP